MPRQFLLILLTVVFFNACSGPDHMLVDQPLQGLRITIDPGHGATQAYDDFRQGPTGEREEWINLRVAKMLASKLRRAGAAVQLTRTTDRDVSLGGRAALAKRFKSDLLVSIHHNGSGNDPRMDLPIVYFFGSARENPASVDLARLLLAGMRQNMTFEQPEAGGVYSDHLIYDAGTSILRNTAAQMPGIIGEGGFFTNPAGEQRLKSRAYNQLEAEVYYQAIRQYFDRGLPAATLLPFNPGKTVNPEEPIQFELTDGSGSNFFDETSFQILQDGQVLPVSWDPVTGLLSAQPRPTEKRQVVFQVNGRNLKGNALHPKPFQVLTEKGAAWYSETAWQVAFERADSLYVQLNLSASEPDSSSLATLNAALHFYQLSLELQLVHPRVQTAERRIMELMKFKQATGTEDLSAEITAQQKKLLEYYPED